jgi:hypothetical protein
MMCIIVLTVIEIAFLAPLPTLALRVILFPVVFLPCCARLYRNLRSYLCLYCYALAQRLILLEGRFRLQRARCDCESSCKCHPRVHKSLKD